MNEAKYSIVLAFGAKQSVIIKEKVREKYAEIRDELYVYNFRTEIEKEAFLKGVDVAIEHNYYEVVSDEELNEIMTIED